MSLKPARFTTLQDWLDWQQTLHSTEIELGLDRVKKVWLSLCESAGRPDNFRLASKVIIVAGTNGKGSSIAYLEAIYTAAGYRVGSFTSPHLYSYTERIRLDSEPVSEQAICDAFACIDQARDDTSLTYFEFGALAAFEIFAAENELNKESGNVLDVVLLEVGLGGRLDAVNIIDADCVLITSIGIDHVAWLGDTRELIGAEKAGVMRSKQLVVCADPQPPESVVSHAKLLGLGMWIYGRDFEIENIDSGWSWRPSKKINSRPMQGLPVPAMRGSAQLQNAASVVAVLMRLYSELPVSLDAVRTGLQSAQIAGRFEVVPGDLTWIYDVAHNEDSTQALVENLKHMQCGGKTRAIFSALDDKDMIKMMQLMDDCIDSWNICALEGSRGRSKMTIEDNISEIYENPEASKLHDNIQMFTHSGEAIKGALIQSGQGDRIVVFGSFVLVAEVAEQMGHSHISRGF